MEKGLLKSIVNFVSSIIVFFVILSISYNDTSGSLNPYIFIIPVIVASIVMIVKIRKIKKANKKENMDQKHYENNTEQMQQSDQSLTNTTDKTNLPKQLPVIEQGVVLPLPIEVNVIDTPITDETNSPKQTPVIEQGVGLPLPIEVNVIETPITDETTNINKLPIILNENILSMNNGSTAKTIDLNNVKWIHTFSVSKKQVIMLEFYCEDGQKIEYDYPIKDDQIVYEAINNIRSSIPKILTSNDRDKEEYKLCKNRYKEQFTI